MKFKKLTLSTFAVMITLLLFSSCASIVSKSAYPLTINSEPNRAKVTVTNKSGQKIFTGKTPAAITLKTSNGFFSKEEYLVQFSSEGYEDKIVPVTCTLDGWYFGNILFGGFIGMLIVDPATGAMWKIETTSLHETLDKKESETLNKKETQTADIQIIDIKNVPENYKPYLVRLN